MLCRTCLKQTENIHPLTHTFSGHEDINFSVMLMSCTSISIEPDDALPHFICENCISALIMAYIFKEQCEKSDLFLRTHECIESFKNTIGKTDLCNKADLNMTTNEKSVLSESVSLKNSSSNKNIKHDRIKENNKYKIKMNGLKSKKICITWRKNDQTEQSEKKVFTDKSKNIFTERINYLSDNKIKIYKNKGKTRVYQCLECDKQFTTCYGLKYHTKHHIGTRKYECPIENCKKTFLWEPTLKRHMELHSVEKKYLCYLCGKAYNASDSLRYHIRNHKGERPHLCMHCGKTFKQAVHLKYHMRSHNGERPHVCTKCNRSYTRPTQLRKHLNKYCGVGKNPPQKRI